MLKKRPLVALLAACLFVGFAAYLTQSGSNVKADEALRIDIPVKLEKANVVFDVGHLVLVGDMPFVLGDLHLIASDYGDGGTQGQIIAVFHGDAAFLILNDDTYNANRHVQTGNPYGKLIAGLMKQGVQIELCGATATANHWVNANLLPGVKVDTNAMVRVTQLEQKGFTLIYE
jgi:intracellular sulfur oxidation DsrE/DsrF family protein